MASNAINLPEGFVLDKPKTNDNLPMGFVLDKIQAGQDESFISPRSNLLTNPRETLARSGGEAFGNIFSAIGHPVRTIKGVAALAGGIIQKIPFSPAGMFLKTRPGAEHREQITEGVADFYKQRFGSIEAAKKTLLEDPVGFAFDMSIFLTGGGAAVTKIGQISRISKLAKAGKAINIAGKTVDPLIAATKILGAGIKGATAGRRIAPFASKLDKPIIQAAKEIGVDLPASAKSTSRVVPITEVAVGKGLFGEEIVKKVERAHSSLNQYADNIIAKTGQSPDLTSAGQAIFKGADAYKNKFIQIKNSLYERALLPKKGQEVIKVTPKNSIDFIDTILQNKQEAAKLLGSSEDIKYFENLSNRLKFGTQEKIGILDTRGKEIVRNIPVHGKEIQSAIRELNQKINNITDPVATGNKGTLKKLVTLMSEDLDIAIVAQRPDLARAIETANKFYSEGIQKLNSAYGEKIFNLAEAKQYDKIVPAIINNSTSIDDIPRIYEIIGKGNKPALQSAFMEEFFKRSKGPTGNFTPYGITQKIKSFGGEGKLKAVLSPEQFNGIKNLEQVAKGLGRAEKIASGSQTAFIGRIMFELGATFTNPLKALYTILGDSAFSKFISSPTGQKLLTEGIPLTGRTGERLIEAAPRIGAVGRGLRAGDIIAQ